MKSKQNENDGIVRVSRETKGRKGSGVSIITGIPLDDKDLKQIAKQLKQKCGTGGTVKSGTIEIQGNHRATLKQELSKLGYTVKICNRQGLALHLDGARLFNALTETRESSSHYGKLLDSISICLSKGLGAPIGSLLLGGSDFIHEAARMRKAFGGGMRQAGFMAAAGLFAL